MAQQAYPDIQGFAPSWADISVTCDVTGGELVDINDVSDISWDDTVEVGMKRGAGGRKMQRTVGQADCSGSIILYRAGARKLENALSSVATTRGNQSLISLVSFTITILHTPVGAETEPPYETLLKGCRIIGRKASHTEGTDPEKIEYTLDIMQVVTKENGKEIALL